MELSINQSACLPAAGAERFYLQPQLLWLESKGSLHMRCIHTWIRSLHFLLSQAVAHPAQHFTEAFSVGAQLGMGVEAVTALVQPFAQHQHAYFVRHTACWFQPPLALAELGSPTATARRGAAQRCLAHAGDPAWQQAFGFLTTHLPAVQQLAGTGDLTPALNQHLDAVYSHVPVTNAACETALKVRWYRLHCHHCCVLAID